MTPPLLLCDLDDTLLDRAATFARWVDGFLAARGMGSRVADHAAWMIEVDARGYCDRRELFGAVKDRFALAEPVEDLVDEFYGAFGPMFRCEEEVRAALSRAREEGWRIAIVTNGPPTQIAKIAAAGLPDLVDGWCISADEGCRKPEVEILRRAASKCGTSLADAWMVGDSPAFDIGAAVAAGIPSVWVSDGGRKWPAALPFAPTVVAASFAEGVDAVLAANEVDQP